MAYRSRDCSAVVIFFDGNGRFQSIDLRILRRRLLLDGAEMGAAMSQAMPACWRQAAATTE